MKAALLVPEDLIVRLGARQPGDLDRVADRGALDRLDRHHRLAEAAVEPLAPGDMRAQAGHEPERADLEDAAQ
jgi:hypothetical protein